MSIQKHLMVKYFVVLAFTLSTGVSRAQVTLVMNTNQDERYLGDLYDSLMGSNLRIYIGKKFYEPLSKELLEGDLYYGGDDWTEGTLGYQGQVYKNVTMRYHTFIDKLIILKPQGHEGIEVPESNIDFFIIHNTRFERLLLPQKGYYAILHNGGTVIFTRHYSTRHEKNTDKNQVIELQPKQKYFIKKNNIVWQVKSKGSVLKVFNEQKTELRKFLRQKKIFFSQNREFALKVLGEEFDRLQNQK